MTKRGIKRKKLSHDPLTETNNFMKEVDESLRMERMTEVWNKYRVSFLISLAIVFIGIAIKDYYFETLEKKYNESSVNFWNYNETLNKTGAVDDGLLEKIISEGSGEYVSLALIKKANNFLAKGENLKAAEVYDEIISSSNNEHIRDLATLYQAQTLAQIENKKAENLFLYLIEKESAFSLSAKELLAYFYEDMGEKNKALTLYEELLSTPSDINGIKRRVQIKKSLLLRSVDK